MFQKEESTEWETGGVSRLESRLSHQLLTISGEVDAMNRIPTDSSKVNKYNCLLRKKSFKESGVRYDTCQRKIRNCSRWLRL